MVDSQIFIFVSLFYRKKTFLFLVLYSLHKSKIKGMSLMFKLFGLTRKASAKVVRVADVTDSDFCGDFLTSFYFFGWYLS